jgi:hypothetical protein
MNVIQRNVLDVAVKRRRRSDEGEHLTLLSPISKVRR